MKTKFMLLVLSLSTTYVSAATVNKKFLNALHQVESSGRLGAIVGDGGKALGPLQIHRNYFVDAAQFDHSLGNDYNRVTDLAFAQRVVNAYLNRYAATAVAENNFEVLARVHNGGPSGFKNRATVRYWTKVEMNLKLKTS